MSYGNIISRGDVAALQKERVMKTQRGPSVSPGVTSKGSGSPAKGSRLGQTRPAFKNIGASPKK